LGLGESADEGSDRETESEMAEVDGEDVVLRWLNIGLSRAREAAKKLLESEDRDGALGSFHSAVEEAADVEEALDLDESLVDGAALSCLAAVLKAERDRRPIAAADFEAMLEDDEDLRVEKACDILAALAPTRRAASLLVPDDIVSAELESTTVCFLACLLLHFPLARELPGEAMPDDLLEEVDDTSRPASPSSTTGPATLLHEATNGDADQAATQAADEPNSTTAQALTKARLEAVLASVEDLAGPAACEGLQDPTLLLHGGEDVQALATTSAEQLLLRWANVQLSTSYHRPVENFGSDLQDGKAIWLLLSAVAPEAVEDIPEEELEQEERLERIISAMSRCVDFELLTANAIVEGQPDMLAAFFAQLFLARPSLAPRKESLLDMHLQLLGRTCQRGMEVLAGCKNTAEVMRFLMELDEKWQEITLASQTVHEANRTMENICNRMRTFLGDTLAHRARGQPRTMLDAKEARELMLYTTLNPDHYSAFAFKEGVDPMVLSRVEDVLRKHFRLLRDIFRNYAQASGNGNGITLEALLKLYQDCKLRCRDLAPHHLESLFCDHLDLSGNAERVLAPQSFIEVMLQCAYLKFKGQYQSLPDMLVHLIEDHLGLYGLAQESENIFQRMTYDPKVREVLDNYDAELRLIFNLYASLDDSTTEAMQRVNTMNIKEFLMLLKHCDLFDAALTETAVEQVFAGIQQSATTELELDMGGNDGLNDDEELAHSEFIDGLVAIAAYKYPDPFMPFPQRVDDLVNRVFANLRKHWSRKRVSPQVDALLNAFQKRLAPLAAR
jgi:hypothetical protein